MKILKQLIFAVAVVFCVSITASAQKDEGKTPKKGNPPIIVPGGKKPKEDKPKDEDRRKKPQINFFFRSED